MNRYQKAQAAKTAARKAEKKAANKHEKLVNIIENFVSMFANEMTKDVVNQQLDYNLNKNAERFIDKYLEAEEIDNPGILEKFFTYKECDEWVKQLAAKNGISFQDTADVNKITKMVKLDQLKLGIYDYVVGHFKMKQGFVTMGNGQKVVINTFVTI